MLSQTQVLLIKIAKLCIEVHAIEGDSKINSISNKYLNKTNKGRPAESNTSVEDDLHVLEHEYNKSSHSEAQSYNPDKSQDNEEPHVELQSPQRLRQSTPTHRASLLPSEKLANSSSLSSSLTKVDMSVSGDTGNLTCVFEGKATDSRNSLTSSGVEMESELEEGESTCPSSLGSTRNGRGTCEGWQTGIGTSSQ